MIDNKHEPDFNDDDIDLSDMINEYDEDDELRRRIQKMKEEKEVEEKRMASLKRAEYEEVQNTSALQRPQREESDSVFDQVREEDSLQQAQTQNTEESDLDKTLVIMNNKFQRSFEVEQESTYQYKNQNIDEEEISDDDIEELLNKEKPKPKKKSMDPDKMNKMITYVIIGIVGTCVLVACFFGVKLLLNGSSSPEVEVKEPEVETPKPDPVTPEPTPDQPANNNPTPTPVDPTKKNQLESAKEQIKIEKANLKNLEAEQLVAQENLDKNFTAEILAQLKTERDKKAGLRDDIAKTLLTVNKDVERLKDLVKSDPTNPTHQTDLDKAVAEQKTLDALSKQYIEEHGKVDASIIKFDTDKQTAEQALEVAKDKVIKKHKAIEALQEQIDSLS